MTQPAVETKELQILLQFESTLVASALKKRILLSSTKILLISRLFERHLVFVADAGALFIQCDGIYDKHSIGVVQFMTTLFTEIKITYHSQCIVIAAIGYCHVGDSVPPVDVVDEDVPDPEWLPQLRINNSKRWLAVADDKIWLSNIIGM